MLVDLALGLGILFYGLAGLADRVGALETLGFGIALVAGAATVYAFWMILATFAFWFVRLENVLQIFWSMYQAGRWPVGIYPPWLRLSLTVVVPVALAVTVPAEALAGRLTAANLALACSVALLRGIPARQLALSLGLAALAYAALTGYDALAVRYVNVRLPYRRVALTS